MPPKFKSPNRPSAGEFRRLLIELGTDLPGDYSLFLRRVNGGEPTPNLLSRKRGDPIEIEHFYALVTPAMLKRKPQLRTVDLLSMTRSFRENLKLPPRYLPVALTRETHDVLLLAITGKATGKVSLWTFIESGFDSTRVSPLAGSFNELLERMVQPVAESAASRRQLFQQLDDALTAGDLNSVRELIPQMDLSKAPRGFVPPAHGAILGANSQLMEVLNELGVDCKTAWEGKTPLKAARQALKDDKESLEIGQFLGLDKRDVAKASARIAELERIIKILSRKR